MSKLTGMPNGRPLLFKSVEELQVKIDGYFEHCDMNTHKVLSKVTGEVIEMNDRLPYLVSKLAVWLNTSRETLMNYQDKEEYFDTIKRAKDKCQADSEERLYLNFTPGVIFSMKNNYGWADKQEIESINHNYNQDITALSDDDINAELHQFDE